VFSWQVIKEDFMERWLEIYEFPGYSISDQGRVRNDNTGRIMSLVQNSGGVLTAYMVREGRQYARGVAKLVATHFLPHDTDMQSAPVHRDGNPLNNTVDNLIWRPRWYAVKYRHQFHEVGRPPYVDRPIQEVTTGLVFPNSWEAAKHFGLIEFDIFKSYHEWQGNGGIFRPRYSGYAFRRFDD
jgi:NUMOD4 motif-containing protein